MPKITKEIIVQKMVDQWVKDNPELVADIEELAAKLTFFNAKWGARLQPTDFTLKSNSL